MGELPINPIGRILKNGGSPRISEDAKGTLAKVLAEYGENISKHAVLLAKNAKRATLKAFDIELALVLLNQDLPSNFHLLNTGSKPFHIFCFVEYFTD
jgi:histone H3/H4